MMIDPDGLLSAQQIINYLKDQHITYKPILSDWKDFGLSERAVQRINSYQPETVYLLDIGCESAVLKIAQKINAKRIYIIDNHPPTSLYPEYDDWRELKDNLSEKFQLIASTESCTAGMVWEYLTSEDFHNNWNDIWAIIGLEADVAINKPQGRLTADKILAKQPALNGHILSVYKKAGETEWRTSEYPLLGRFSAIFNASRRVAYNEGAVIAFQALDEIQNQGDIYALLMLKESDINAGTTPNLFGLIHNYTIWDKQWFKDAFGEGKAVQLKFEKFGVTLINHPWNLGSRVCNYQSDHEGVSWACVNIGTPGMTHISGRLGTHVIDNRTVIELDKPPHIQKVENEGHIGLWFQSLSAVSNNKITGGGIKEAGSALCAKNITIQEILNALVRAFKSDYKESFNKGTSGVIDNEIIHSREES